MAEATTITPQIPNEHEEMPSTSTDTDLNSAMETKKGSSAMSIEISANSIEDLAASSSHTSLETPNRSNPSKDDPDSSPMALQSLVLAAASDLMEVSPRSASDIDTPTSQGGTPHANRNQVEKGKSEATSTTSEQSEQTKSKPKGILRKKPRYTSTVPIVLDSNSDLSPTTGNTIHNMNQYRKNRGNSDFDFDFLDIDRLVDKDDDHFYNSENGGSTTLLSVLWSLVVMPVVLLGYGGLPYIVLASTVWTLIFVARWIRRFLVEEFSMRRNGSLKEEAQKSPIPPAVESPFPAKSSSISEPNSQSNLSGILSVISPVAGARKTKVRFPEGIKFPERKLLRQPIPRIQKPTKQKIVNSRTIAKKPFFGEENGEGDTWSLDSLMVLRNYMKDTDYSHDSNDNGLNPTPLSVMAPPPPYPPTLTTATTPSENATASGDEADDECTDSASSLEEDHSDNDEVPELISALARRRDSLMLFPQDNVQPLIQFDDDMDDEPIDDYYQEGLFGKSDSSSPTVISDSKLRKKASRYRRRKPRDSLCFTFGKKSVVPECPSIPQCPSDELEFLEQKKQEKFEQAVVIEHLQQSSFSDTVEEVQDVSEGTEPYEEEIDNGYEIDDRDAPSSNDLLEEILAEDSDATTSLTSGSWDENEKSSEHKGYSFIDDSDDDDIIYDDVDEHSFENDVSGEEEMTDTIIASDFDERVDEALQQHKSEEIPIVEETVLQEISFDESDEVECILSPNAFQYDENEADKFTFEEENDPIEREVLESSSDLQLEISATDDDVECKLSQIQTAETEMSTFDEGDDIDAEYMPSSPLGSPQNKENFVRKIAIDQSNSPWSPAFPRAVLSPTN